MGGMGAVGGDIKDLALEQILQVYEQQLERGRRVHVVRASAPAGDALPAAACGEPVARGERGARVRVRVRAAHRRGGGLFVDHREQRGERLERKQTRIKENKKE